MEPKSFTPEQANEALADVRPLAQRLVRERRRQLRAEAIQARARRKVAGNGGGLRSEKLLEAQRESAGATEALERIIDSLIELGVQVKDLDRGLLDFPASHPATGEPVLLCWHLGEPAVSHWHGLIEGFAGRKPLPF